MLDDGHWSAHSIENAKDVARWDVSHGWGDADLIEAPKINQDLYDRNPDLWLTFYNYWVNSYKVKGVIFRDMEN